jgi:outer membrane lipopolysaccharide assembly protein LptE/RlpB
MRFTFLLPMAALFLSGCMGYHLGPVKPKYMVGIDSIAVSTFKNDTLRARVEVMLADSLIKQLQQDGTFQVKDGNDADAIIKGTLQQVTRSPSRSVFGNVLLTQEYNLILRCRFQVFKRATGQLIDEREVQGQTSFFVNGSENIAADINSQERQALPLAAEDLMVRYCSLLTEGW